MKTIESAQNPHLKHLAKLLTSAKTRRQHRQSVAEGVHLLEAYLNTGALPEQVWLSPQRMHHPDVQALLPRLPPQNIYLAQAQALNKISALNEADGVLSLIALPDHTQKPLPLHGDCVVLDDIQDPGNMGTLLRNAAAAGVQQIVYSKNCADAWSPKVLRAGMGAHFALHLYECADLPAWLADYRDTRIATALSAQSVCVYDVDLRAPCAWIFGNEGAGVSAAVQASADVCAVIPMAAGSESLNVAAAAAVCLFEQQRQRR